MRLKRTFQILAVLLIGSTAIHAQNRLIIEADNGKTPSAAISNGHFPSISVHCIYGGYWVGENSSVPNNTGYSERCGQALKDIRIPNLRWPGGCFADEYHWMDGIGPRENGLK